MRTSRAILGTGVMTALPLLYQTPASAISIRDSLEGVSAGITISVLRETSIIANPSYCSPAGAEPKPLECLVVLRSAHNPVSYGSELGADAAGRKYNISLLGDATALEFSDGDGAFIERMDSAGQVESIARIYNRRCVDAGCTSMETFYYFPNYIGAFDLLAGRMVMIVRAVGNGDDSVGIAEIRGLPTLFDTLLTFVPGQQSMNVLVPTMPDGFRTADSLQVWTGDMRSMPDWSQAQSLSCEAAANPSPGEVVSVADTLPDPAVGEGRYYLVASRKGADRRLGRQYVNGSYSAREPAGLPGCQ